MPKCSRVNFGRYYRTLLNLTFHCFTCVFTQLSMSGGFNFKKKCIRMRIIKVSIFGAISSEITVSGSSCPSLFYISDYASHYIALQMKKMKLYSYPSILLIFPMYILCFQEAQPFLFGGIVLIKT